MTREFNFLPELPKSKLDDREFADLVNECLLRIPRYCPEWTNYNPSDPGVTLIELFAWLTDQMLLRFNEIPRLNYITFLELLGIRLQPPTPAKCHVTFYLTTSFPEAKTILAGTEVATERTESEEAIIFATDQDVIVSQPIIKHLLTSTEKELTPKILDNPFRDRDWIPEQNGKEWRGRETNLFAEQPQEGNCFYIVFNPDEPITGNVIVLNIKALAATTTGIIPENPPRLWEAWSGDGEKKGWVPILVKETYDVTEGFSFKKFAREGGIANQEGADITLHLPLNLPSSIFDTYEGRWIRCSYTPSQSVNNDYGYTRPPRIISISVRSIGASSIATQSFRIENEILGESNGKAGQTFQLQRTPILPRNVHLEYILVTPPGEQAMEETWSEVEHFGESGEEDRHYTIDAITGRVQFGPLIREPAQIKESTQVRYRLQKQTDTNIIDINQIEPQSRQRQYGKVPPRGSMITMGAYRTGGGQAGNVPKGTIRILKSAVPYIARVENYQPGRGGRDAENLNAAVIKVPQFLRTRDRAVTKEDFETLAMTVGTVARSHCSTPQPGESDYKPGRVRLLLIPHPAHDDAIEKCLGFHPSEFNLTPELKKQVNNYLDERRLLGIEIIYKQPEYLGVSVQIQVALEPEYDNSSAREEIKKKLLIALYRFLNPITGGFDNQGWPFQRPVYSSDIVRLFQPISGVRSIGVIRLYEIRQNQVSEMWERNPEPRTEIKLSPLELICSWSDQNLADFEHKVDLL